MSQKLFDYECPTHGVFETWGSSGKGSPCPKCGRLALQMIGFKGVLGDFKDENSRAGRMWADHHERMARAPENPDVDELGY